MNSLDQTISEAGVTTVKYTLKYPFRDYKEGTALYEKTNEYSDTITQAIANDFSMSAILYKLDKAPLVMSIVRLKIRPLRNLLIEYKLALRDDHPERQAYVKNMIVNSVDSIVDDISDLLEGEEEDNLYTEMGTLLIYRMTKIIETAKKLEESAYYQ